MDMPLIGRIIIAQNYRNHQFRATVLIFRITIVVFEPFTMASEID